MEVLAVLLILAVVSAMVAPTFRSARYDIKQAQAKAAALKVAEATREYYQVSRGQRLKVCFTPESDDGRNIMQEDECQNPAATGIPRKSATTQTTIPSTPNNNAHANDPEAGRLFACGYLSFKDFTSLPYTFCTYRPSGLPDNDNPPADTSVFYAVAYAAGDKAGRKYYKNSNPTGYIYIGGSMDPQDTYDD